MANEVTIPALPCASINNTLDFYSALGFEITYQQTRPNTYAVVKYEEIELHFFSMKGYEPQNSYSTCLVLIDEADVLYQVFAANLKTYYGKLPAAGIPRITRPNNKNASRDYRFNIVDPGGNWIRFIQRITPDEVKTTKARPTKHSRAINAASLLISAKGDFPGAAKMLDTVLGQAETPLERVPALVLRMEVALNMSDQALAKALLEEIHQASLSETQKAELAEPLQQAEELAQLIE